MSFFLILFGFYFVMSWSPRLMVAAGLSNEQGITGGVLLNLGGIVGTSLIGLLAGRLALYKVHAMYLVATAVLMSVLLSLAGGSSQTLVVAFLLGLFVNGCVAGVFAMTPMIYEPAHRVTGTWLGYRNEPLRVCPGTTGCRSPYRRTVESRRSLHLVRDNLRTGGHHYRIAPLWH
ncbi:hypothetical protein ACTMU2_17295 [Cupriavidus basilensis]